MGIPINSREEVRRLQECNLRTSRVRKNIQQTKDSASLRACQVPGTDGGTNMTTTSPKYSHTIFFFFATYRSPFGFDVLLSF
jgi:hypothetical protein